MKKITKILYLNSPICIKQQFANLEAIRRNIYRRSGNYKTSYTMIDIDYILKNYSENNQLEKINKLLDHVNRNIPYYKKNSNYDLIKSIDDFKNLPLTSKKLMNNNIECFINPKKKKTLWEGKTSGSTGSPFQYYRDSYSIQYEYALYDKLYNFVSGQENPIKARFSGVSIIKANISKPPFWFYINKFKQLQLSAYHIDTSTFESYLKAFVKYKPNIGTGYASAWLFLSQYIIANKTKSYNFNAIVTDSEGLSIEDKLLVEKAFQCPVYQTYGLGEIGMIGVQCSAGHYHIFTERCFVEVVDGMGNALKNGEEGELVVTDLDSYDAPFIRYRTGDRGIINDTNCSCGWETPYIKKIVGRIDDFVVTTSGKKIGRLSHIAKPAIGVIAMQLVQKHPGYLEIRVLPGKDFDRNSMIEVLNVSKEYLGDMKVTWEVVNYLEQTKSGKTKFVIREF